MEIVEGYQDSVDNDKNNVIREFVGKVKIILVDSPKKVYLRRRWAAAFVTLSQTLIGATNIIMLFYVLSFKSEILTNLHIFLCTIGFQLLVPSGIFSFSYYNGSTIPMSEKDKKFEHIFLETVGILCCIFGSTAIILETGFRLKTTIHATTGILASCLILLSGFTGPCNYGHGITMKIIKCIHVITGVFAFLASSLCFVLGLFRPSIEKWVPVSSVIPFLVIFCILYTTAVALSPLINCTKA